VLLAAWATRILHHRASRVNGFRECLLLLNDFVRANCSVILSSHERGTNHPERP
jgi:hypothetical protein